MRKQAQCFNISKKAVIIATFILLISLSAVITNAFAGYDPQYTAQVQNGATVLVDSGRFYVGVEVPMEDSERARSMWLDVFRKVNVGRYIQGVLVKQEAWAHIEEKAVQGNNIDVVVDLLDTGDIYGFNIAGNWEKWQVYEWHNEWVLTIAPYSIPNGFYDRIKFTVLWSNNISRPEHEFDDGSPIMQIEDPEDQDFNINNPPMPSSPSAPEYSTATPFTSRALLRVSDVSSQLPSYGVIWIIILIVGCAIGAKVFGFW